MNKTMTYPGFYQGRHGVTMLARDVPDGWHLGQVLGLADQTEAEWDKYDSLPPGLRVRHTALHKVAVGLAREKSWYPELGEDQ